ncbi:MAG TPA: HAMP domain-containing sensor histidine kinase, partial [Terriglobales bacterium]|nr:HAMP domain-containing sensor histidine kinase [Terriglobales bacterium]
QRLVNELLELARIDSGGLKLEKQSVDLSSLLQKVAEKLRPQAETAKIELKITQSARLELTADYDRLVEVFTNLVDNAIKHAHTNVDIHFVLEKGFAKVGISDDGEGIPASEIQRVFERFYQVDKSRRTAQGRGTGLGLSIAQQIVLAHNGRIEAESQVGKGSSFIVFLPIETKR